MLPSRKEMMAYWFEHPIAGTFIAFGMVEGIKTIWESFVNPKGKSPFSTYTDIRSGAVLDELGHLTPKQQQDLDEVKKGLKAASKMHAKQSAQLTKASSMHAEQAKQLTAASKMHAGQAKTIEQLGNSHLEETPRQIKLKEVVVPQPPNEAGVDREAWYQGHFDHMYRHHEVEHYDTHKGDKFFGSLGSTSTTTSTSSAHGGNERTPTGSTWDKHSLPGEKVQMFGGKKKGSVLMGPPSMRRRISLNSITLGGVKVPKQIDTQEESLPVSGHFGMIGMMPEQSEDATDNPWV
ncbi:MAG: hypothetical protein CM15mV57_560 [uncultured marine virus]|nr:MAG: hypothetical protein CM15mV57_560 [uncultured marine virus]